MRTRIEARNARVVESVETVANASPSTLAKRRPRTCRFRWKRAHPVRKLKLLADRARAHRISEACRA
jgi:hypothetical protein